MFRKTLAAAGALLALFHGWLLVGQAWDGQLADPGVLFRWFIAGALVWSLLALRRQGAPVFFGRKAVAIWLLRFSMGFDGLYAPTKTAAAAPCASARRTGAGP